MKNEDKVVELLSEMVVKQDQFVNQQSELVNEIKDIRRVQERQENLLFKILEVLSDDVPKFDEVLEIENLKDGRIILKKAN
ncbi:MAG: hypothetical protein AAGF85_20010 [Bacteroidota bacterium]